MQKRVAISYFSLMIVFGILIVNLFIVILGYEISPSATQNNTHSVELSSSRGMIYDCNMKKLVNNSPKNVTVMLPTTNALNCILPFTDNDEQEKIYNNMSEGKVSVIRTPEKFSENDIKSITLNERYSNNQHCVHLIGHLDDSGNGATGLERAYNELLSHQGGTLKAVWNVDARGHILYGEGIDFKNNGYLSPAGIQLTINADIQEIVENALSEHNIGRGAAVLMDAQSGEILALTSLPTFDPNNLSASVNDTNSPFLNRAVTPYSVGSVFKPFVAAAAIENNINAEHTCTGNITIGSTSFGCNNNTAHGNVNMKTAMEKSCNTYFIALGQKVGNEKLLSLCSEMGLGKSIELADNFNLKAGYLPKNEEITSPQDLANLSFGQGKLMASPIQMAAAYSVFANGGVYRPPTLMKAIIDSNGEAVQKVTLPESCRVLGKSTVKEIDRLLRSVVTDGNGNKAYSKFTDGRGKTATAQSGWYKDGREISHTWFCGYFTAGDRKITTVIMKEDGISGASDCAPIFKDISEKVTEYMK